jgi:hypothetical protein
MKRRRWLRLTVVFLILACVVWLLRGYVVHRGESDRTRVGDGAKSADLPHDLELMWETKPLRGSPDPDSGVERCASTDRAIKAAERVFNSVELAGKSRDEVLAALGDPKTSNKSMYNFPFWPAPPNALVYRIDCGSYGWQFNVLFDEADRVRDVERLWVH